MQNLLDGHSLFKIKIVLQVAVFTGGGRTVGNQSVLGPSWAPPNSVAIKERQDTLIEKTLLHFIVDVHGMIVAKLKNWTPRDRGQGG